MVWTTPTTWTVDQLVTAANLNVQLRDNMNALKSPPSAEYEVNEGADYSTSGTSFGDVDATKLALTITTAGGWVFVGFVGSVLLAAGVNNYVYFNVHVDGGVVAADDGICMARNNDGTNALVVPVAFLYPVTGLAAAEYTFKLQWKVSGSAATLYAGAGTSKGDVHPKFFVREM